MGARQITGPKPPPWCDSRPITTRWPGLGDSCCHACHLRWVRLDISAEMPTVAMQCAWSVGGAWVIISIMMIIYYNIRPPGRPGIARASRRGAGRPRQRVEISEETPLYRSAPSPASPSHACERQLTLDGPFAQHRGGFRKLG
jgi:hypothetical protein